MSRIACLGWGSLVWDPREFPIQPPWFSDGPPVRIDFLRESSGHRITLVLAPAGSLAQSLWVIMNATDIDEARRALRNRENIPTRNAGQDIGSWSRGDPPPTLIIDLPQWAQARNIDAVVWTALKPKFAGETGRVPTIDEVISYLSALTGETRGDAERYVRRAPKQIDTPYRRKIEASLGWTSLESV